MELKPRFTTPTTFLSAPDPKDPARAERAAIISRLEQIPGAWRFAAQRISSLVPVVDRTATARSTAVAKWRDIVLVKPEASVLGRTLLSDLLSFSTDLHLSTIISDVCAPKATSTLSKRGNHILFFVEFCQKLHFEPFPVLEATFYKFLRDARCSKSATTAQSCRESMHMASSLIGLDGALQAADSPRVVGLCRRLLLGKRPRKQAKV